jgi:hypothetical protein
LVAKLTEAGSTALGTKNVNTRKPPVVVLPGQDAPCGTLTANNVSAACGPVKALLLVGSTNVARAALATALAVITLTPRHKAPSPISAAAARRRPRVGMR